MLRGSIVFFVAIALTAAASISTAAPMNNDNNFINENEGQNLRISTAPAGINSPSLQPLSFSGLPSRINSIPNNNNNNNNNDDVTPQTSRSASPVSSITSHMQAGGLSQSRISSPNNLVLSPSSSSTSLSSTSSERPSSIQQAAPQQMQSSGIINKFKESNPRGTILGDSTRFIGKNARKLYQKTADGINRNAPSAVKEYNRLVTGAKTNLQTTHPAVYGRISNFKKDANTFLFGQQTK
ncbi:hypothetical protein BDF19DRAFT_433573 [Syncephalis fuscata]|nr:hypothetical protein BDF19DRAFT_433573 [Syncephalis fuscata]